jgi:hypothetical protein
MPLSRQFYHHVTWFFLQKAQPSPEWEDSLRGTDMILRYAVL